MTSSPVRGTEGYAEAAAELIQRYDSLAFADVHRPVLHLIPPVPCSALDIGAGTGRDAAHLAALGHRVVAVEPTDALRIPAMALHPSPLIEWVDDSLPDLAVVRARRQSFDLVMLTAVWAHLDAQQRRAAMPSLASLLGGGGIMLMSIRHGPAPPARPTFDVSAEETIELARAQGLAVRANLRTESVQEANRRAGVTWTRLAFVRA
ncbi:MAG TPA: class I SAM-dependent methyltransferase [Stellaceae bacterium]|nr:class I SAM-dependent methyltransferase [Stellaceae bacterium]